MFENIYWGLIMDATLITLACAIISVAGTIVANTIVNHRGYKDVDKKVGKLDNTTLSGQHNALEHKMNEQTKELENKIGTLDNTTLSGQHNRILDEIKEIKSDLQQDRREKELRVADLGGNVSGNIARLQVSVKNLSDFSDLITHLADDLAEANQKVISLEKDKNHLSLENKQLRKIIQDAGISVQPQNNGQLYGTPSDPHEQTFTQS